MDKLATVVIAQAEDRLRKPAFVKETNFHFFIMSGSGVMGTVPKMVRRASLRCSRPFWDLPGDCARVSCQRPSNSGREEFFLKRSRVFFFSVLLLMISQVAFSQAPAAAPAPHQA